MDGRVYLIMIGTIYVLASLPLYHPGEEYSPIGTLKVSPELCQNKNETFLHYPTQKQRLEELYEQGAVFNAIYVNNKGNYCGRNIFFHNIKNMSNLNLITHSNILYRYQEQDVFNCSIESQKGFKTLFISGIMILITGISAFVIVYLKELATK